MHDLFNGLWHIRVKSWLSWWLSLAVISSLPATPAFAWGPVGQGLIGNWAVDQLRPPTRAKVMELLGISSAEALTHAVDQACFWPDTVRDTAEWSWSAPLHYVNLPRYSDRYSRERDCPEGLCVTEGILKYAAVLSRSDLDRASREQAFAWLCHLVGDLHQPLHAGFRDDLGGNRVKVQYRGKSYNLHQFWDSGLVSVRLDGGEQALPPVGASSHQAGSQHWDPADVIAWTEESHALARDHAYPPGKVISEEFADASWVIILEQWRKAAAGLALILESVLGEEQPVRQP